MKIKLSSAIQIDIDEDKLVNWSCDRFTGIYTFTLTDGTTWKYESKCKKLYLLDN